MPAPPNILYIALSEGNRTVASCYAHDSGVFCLRPVGLMISITVAILTLAVVVLLCGIFVGVQLERVRLIIEEWDSYIPGQRPEKSKVVRIKIRPDIRPL